MALSHAMNVMNAHDLARLKGQVNALNNQINAEQAYTAAVLAVLKEHLGISPYETVPEEVSDRLKEWYFDIAKQRKVNSPELFL